MVHGQYLVVDRVIPKGVKSSLTRILCEGVVVLGEQMFKLALTFTVSVVRVL